MEVEEEQFRRLAEVLREPLAAVRSMREQERSELIQLLLKGSEQPAHQGGAQTEQSKPWAGQGRRRAA